MPPSGETIATASNSNCEKRFRKKPERYGTSICAEDIQGTPDVSTDKDDSNFRLPLNKHCLQKRRNRYPQKNLLAVFTQDVNSVNNLPPVVFKFQKFTGVVGPPLTDYAKMCMKLAFPNKVVKYKINMVHRMIPFDVFVGTVTEVNDIKKAIWEYLIDENRVDPPPMEQLNLWHKKDLVDEINFEKLGLKDGGDLSCSI